MSPQTFLYLLFLALGLIIGSAPFLSLLTPVFLIIILVLAGTTHLYISLRRMTNLSILHTRSTTSKVPFWPTSPEGSPWPTTSEVSPWPEPTPSTTKPWTKECWKCHGSDNRECECMCPICEQPDSSCWCLKCNDCGVPIRMYYDPPRRCACDARCPTTALPIDHCKCAVHRWSYKCRRSSERIYHCTCHIYGTTYFRLTVLEAEEHAMAHEWAREERNRWLTTEAHAAQREHRLAVFWDDHMEDIFNDADPPIDE